MRFIILCFLAALLCAGCNSSKDEPTAPPKTVAPDVTAETPNEGADPSSEVRTAAVAADAELYGRVEGVDASNACASDTDCVATGCSKEVCAAEEAMTSCEVLDWPQGEGATCGCVNSTCVWYR